MKFISFLVFTICSVGAFAEHDAIYCGKIYRGTGVRSDRPTLVLDLDKRAEYNGDWADDFGYGSAFASISILSTGETISAKIVKALKKGNPNTRYCAKGRWGGSAYDSWNVKNVHLTSDNVQRFDLASAFKIKE